MVISDSVHTSYIILLNKNIPTKSNAVESANMEAGAYKSEAFMSARVIKSDFNFSFGKSSLFIKIYK